MEEQLQDCGNEPQRDDAPKCGGKPKPEPKVGEVGFWDCVNDEWVWIQA